MKKIHRTFVVVAAFVTLGVASTLPTACTSDDGSGTTGKRIVLGVRVVGEDTTTSFTNAYDWNVTLSKAWLSVGPLYYFDGATILSDVRPIMPLEWLKSALVEKRALAHPGHYLPGNALGQFLGATSVDLRTETVIGSGDGVSGTVRSATFTFPSPVVGPFATELGTHVAILEGMAQKGPDTKLFRAEIDEADILNADGAKAVEGCPFAETTMEADGVVTLTIRVANWFDQVDFDETPASEDGKPVLMSESVARNALVRGMKEGIGYAFSYAPSLLPR